MKLHFFPALLITALQLFPVQSKAATVHDVDCNRVRQSPRRLTRLAPSGSFSDVSPKGEIAYVQFKPGTPELWMMELK